MYFFSQLMALTVRHKEPADKGEIIYADHPGQDRLKLEKRGQGFQSYKLEQSPKRVN